VYKIKEKNGTVRGDRYEKGGDQVLEEEGGLDNVDESERSDRRESKDSSIGEYCLTV
jgi:hypothetical protein